MRSILRELLALSWAFTKGLIEIIALLILIKLVYHL